MKVLFAVSTEDIADKIIKIYQREYKEIISSKNVYYFNAIIKELQRNQTYDRIVISEDLEPFTNNNYEAIDKFIFEKLDGISDEAIDREGRDIPIVVICSERREKSDNLLVKLFSIGVYDALIGNDRTIENVCNLLNKPRTKKEAKTYYRIEQGEYEREDEKNVSEIEIQNILSHYRKLGKNEDRYVESFDSIAEQYNDDQLKIIIKFLPMEVKAVLESKSRKYQSIMTYSADTVKKDEAKKSNLNVSKIIDGHSRQPSGPVIIPSAMRKGNEVRKITGLEEPEPIEAQPLQFKSIEPQQVERRQLDRRQGDRREVESQVVGNDTNAILEEIESIEGVAPITPIEPIETITSIGIDDSAFDDIMTNNTPIEEPEIEIETPELIAPVEQPVKRGRGRPKKVVTEAEEQQSVNTPKRGRGRPRKNPAPTVDIGELEQPKQEQALPQIPTLPEFEEEQDTPLQSFPEFEEEDEEDTLLPGLKEIDEIQEIEELPRRMHEPVASTLPGFEKDKEEEDRNYNMSSSTDLEEIEEDKEVDISYLLTQDKKIVSFVGTSKNGVSFLVNNIAEILSNNGIKTAIVDLTRNKNSYYIYTENREELREIAYASMENLKQGNAIGIEVNRNLTVYTSSPNIRNTGYSIENMLTTLVKNYSLVLLDCDYSTNKEYFRVAQEIYMVQSMDVLTIQPLTEFLRKLKLNNILQPEKLRAIINKAQKIRGLNEEMVVGGMSTYNDPEMSIQDRLFDMRAISKTVIPFDIDAYSIYLSGIANCEISTRGYNKVFMNCLNRLADQVYPVVSGGALKRKNRENMNGRNYANYEQNGTRFSNNMSNTLNEMRKQYK